MARENPVVILVSNYRIEELSIMVYLECHGPSSEVPESFHRNAIGPLCLSQPSRITKLECMAERLGWMRLSADQI